MNTDLRFEFKVDLKPVSHASHRHRMAKISNEPKLRQYLVLAYQIQDTIAEGKAAVILKETEPNKWKGSFRTTKDTVDVARIAKALGGGGHKKAAGFSREGTREQAFEQIFQVMRDLEF